MSAALLPCPFCGDVPTFTGVEEMDDRRYAQMGLECCATMHTTIPWPRWSDLGPAKLSNELKAALTADWNKRAAIAPPVAAGSVDLQRYHNWNGHMLPDSASGAYVDYDSAVAWGEEQREAGRQSEAAHILHLTHERDLALASTRAYAERAEKAEANEIRLQQLIIEAQDRAVKAEADLKQVNEWRAAALTESQKLGELWASKVEQAEARVKELEAAISKDDLVLRASVPKRWKGGANPVFCVQSYIAELEEIAHNHGINPLYLDE